MKKSISTILSIFVLFSCSPSKVIFNESVKNDMISNGFQLTQIQYYLNSQVKLMNEDNLKQDEMQGGKLTTKSLKVRNLIVFKEDTEGVLVREDKDTGILFLKFENGGIEKEIKFGLHVNNRIREYRLLVENTQRTIKYDGAEYKVFFDTENPSLLISKKEYMKIKNKVRYAKGVKLPK